MSLRESSAYLPLECWDCPEYVSRPEMMDCLWNVVWMGSKVAKAGSDIASPSDNENLEGGYPF